MPRSRLLPCSWALSALALAGCGGDGGPDRGALLAPPVTVATLDMAQIDASAATLGLQSLAGKARCDVKVVALHYVTVGPQGEETNVSGALYSPAGACIGAAPLLAYARGTEFQQPRTMADPTDRQALMMIAIFAAQGYAVVTSDYLGYARSSFGFHPYLHADSEASSMIDAIRAARRAAPGLGLNLSGKVMLAGFSQGGHASMATQRLGEQAHADEFNIVAGAHLSGPYQVSASLKEPLYGYQYTVPFVVTSAQKVYGDAYRQVGDVFKQPYAGYIETLLPSPTLNQTTLLTSGMLPGLTGETPTQARDAVFQAAFIADLAGNPRNSVFLAVQRNDLLGWTPKAPTLLCDGAADPTVPPAVNTAPLMADFAARGLHHVRHIDVDAQVQAAFAPGGQAPTDTGSAAFRTYHASYHGLYVRPLCYLQARAFFEPLK